MEAAYDSIWTVREFIKVCHRSERVDQGGVLEEVPHSPFRIRDRGPKMSQRCRGSYKHTASAHVLRSVVFDHMSLVKMAFMILISGIINTLLASLS